MRNRYDKTIAACFVGYIVQAVVNNFVPLLFLRFQRSYQIPLRQITLLVTFNFVIQLMTDLFFVGFVDRIGYRASMILAHCLSAGGLILLTILPDILPAPFAGIAISVMIYAVGGGLLEVLVSPVVEACPSDNKEKAMSMLHSFYSWGFAGVVLVSTLFFYMAGIENWKILTVIWAVLPICNAAVFAKVPIAPLIEDGKQGMKIAELFRNRLFWILMIMMLCSGASEQAVGQWASTFAEEGLGVSKTLGDLAGPMAFAVLMGMSRFFYGKYGDRINLDRFMIYSSVIAKGHIHIIDGREDFETFQRGYQLLCTCNNRKVEPLENKKTLPAMYIGMIVCDMKHVTAKSEFPLRKPEDVPFINVYEMPEDTEPFDISDIIAKRKKG